MIYSKEEVQVERDDNKNKINQTNNLVKQLLHNQYKIQQKKR